MPPDVQNYILHYLAGYQREASRALRAATELASFGQENQPADNMVVYWRHVLSALKWLEGRVPQKQRWLAEIEAFGDTPIPE